MQQFSARTSAETNNNTATVELTTCLPLQLWSLKIAWRFLPPPSRPTLTDTGRPGVAVRLPSATNLLSSEGHLIVNHFVAPSVALKLIFQFPGLLQQIYFFLPPLCDKVSHNPFHRRRLASQQGAEKCNHASARSCRCIFNRPCKSSQVTVTAFQDCASKFQTAIAMSYSGA